MRITAFAKGRNRTGKEKEKIPKTSCELIENTWKNIHKSRIVTNSLPAFSMQILFNLKNIQHRHLFSRFNLFKAQPRQHRTICDGLRIVSIRGICLRNHIEFSTFPIQLIIHFVFLSRCSATENVCISKLEVNVEQISRQSKEQTLTELVKWQSLSCRSKWQRIKGMTRVGKE